MDPHTLHRAELAASERFGCWLAVLGVVTGFLLGLLVQATTGVLP